MVRMVFKKIKIKTCMGGGIFLIQKNFASWIGGKKINVGP